MDDFVDRRTMIGGLVAVVFGKSWPIATDAHSVVMNVANVPGERHSFGGVRRYLQGSVGGLKSLLVSQTTLNAGQEPHPPHSHPEAEILVVAQGSGEIDLQGEISHVGPGAFLYAAPGDLHGIKNTGSTAMIYYVFRWLSN